MKSKLLTGDELNAKLKQCITLIDEIFAEDFIRTALFVYQLDEGNEDVYTSAISTLESGQLIYLLQGFIKGEDEVTGEIVYNKPLLN